MTTEEKKEIIKYYVGYCKSLYDQEKNPLYIWRAILFCKEGCEAYPTWIKNYLEETAATLLKIRNPHKDAPALIKRALGLYTARYFSEFHDSWKKDEAFDRVNEERKKRKRGKKDFFIFDDVAKQFGVKADTIRKWYQDIKKWRDEITKDE